MPFGLAEMRPLVPPDNLLRPAGSELAVLTPRKATIARTRKFERPEAAVKMFDYWQRQRKSWWKKFSNSPGHISIESINQGSVGIVMTFPELPPLTIETICQLGSKPFEEMPRDIQSSFQLKDGRKLVLPHVVESCTSIETAVLTFLCDALEERNSDQIVLALHRKLAPYKIAFAAAPSGNISIGQDIADLAGFLARVLRQAGVSTMLLPDLGKKSLESQLVRYDELGVPYCVVLNEGSLKNGILALRNRDTTLKEQVHVAEIKSYVKILMKNY
ncbi:hypothetical protein B566_EDAN012025 [Ephemera danica]|nr:hypothetical protein B566_EDAN012025 [Ephemera danica]